MQLQPDYIYKKEIYDFDGTYLLDKHLTIQRDYNFLHYHNVFEIGMVVEGNGTFLINNQIKYFSKGDISVMYPGDFHITNSEGVGYLCGTCEISNGAKGSAAHQHKAAQEHEKRFHLHGQGPP